MRFILGVIICILFTASSVYAPVPDLSSIQNDFSPETFAHINSTKTQKEYRKFDLKGMNKDARRWALLWYSWFVNKQTYKGYYNKRACILMLTTYLAAYLEIRSYYQYRYFYVNTLEYEIGYLTYELIRKYQMMIEIYQVMYFKFFMNQAGWSAPIPYMFYMYRLELELGMHISHLVRMLHEIEEKYKGAPLGHWDDYPASEEEGKKVPRNKTKQKIFNAEADYEKRRLQEYKKRRKEMKKKRKLINLETRVTPAPKNRYKSFWPLHYGWSIEFW